MRVLLAVADTDESVRVARTTHDLFGESATYLVMSVGEQRLPLLGPDPMMWGVPYPLALAPTAGVAPLVRAPLDNAGADVASAAPDQADAARAHADRIADAAHLPSADRIGEVGDVAERIRTVAEEEHADVIVVGASDHGWFRSLLHPSVSRAVLRDADRPVLVIP